MGSTQGLPIGKGLPDWTPRELPSREPLVGRYCRLEALDPDLHAEALFAANGLDEGGLNWTYLPYGPFPDLPAYRQWVVEVSKSDDPLFFAILDLSGNRLGVASYLRMAPSIGSIEVGHINYSPLLQRRREATEAMYLMMRRVFEELGYRRYEWKCDALHDNSRCAAERLGFVYEGTFRQATIYKGRNRDTAWYSIIDSDWPRVGAELGSWLEPSNFDADGVQRSRLAVGRRTSRSTG